MSRSVSVGQSHRVKQLHLKDELLCNSHTKPALRLLKRHDGTRHDDDACVFSKCFPGVLLTPNILESDKVKFFCSE